ncbi:MAG: DNA translocase FtsK 4TM domain-containing protein [Candidatus Ratteibacteria bacterium]
MGNHRKKVSGFLLIGAAIFVFFSLISFHEADPVFSTFQIGWPVYAEPVNFGGYFGANLSAAAFFLFGHFAYLFFFALFLAGWAMIWSSFTFSLLELFSLAGLLIAGTGLLDTLRTCMGWSDSGYSGGGILGILTASFVRGYFGSKGGIFLLGLTTAGFLFALSRLFLLPFEAVRETFFLRDLLPQEEVPSHSPSKIKFSRRSGTRAEPSFLDQKKPISKRSGAKKPNIMVSSDQIPVESETKSISATSLPLPSVLPDSSLSSSGKKKYRLPLVTMLKRGKSTERETKEDLERYAQVIEETLSDFGIEGEIVQINQGPRVTLYELQPAPGIPISRITRIADNISMSLKASSIRMVAPLPGKSTIGIEVPNREITLVYLREIFESREFLSSPSKLTIAIGENILGRPVVSDLKLMPHLLIAGATGSGKTVCLNSLITSILYKASPEEVRFLMIDPKMVELILYNDIPHLLLPVIVDIKEAVTSLKWLIREMSERYKSFAQVKARNIETYNSHPEVEEKLPYIVVVIDELADLMMIAKNEIEQSVIRLAALSRAAGIHLILATQRPSVNVITGVIKANLPCRIAFQVASKFDSQTILDSVGAEKLLGRGDLLFLPPGKSHPVRSQGCYISDEEIEEVTGFWKSQGETEYRREILTHTKEEQDTVSFTMDGSEDDLYHQAVRLVLETKIASISMLQRRLKIGFNKSARLVERMEEEGIVGAYREGKPRTILKGLHGDQEHSLEDT